MEKNGISLILLLGLLCSILSGCGKQAGSEFVGTWMSNDGFWEDNHVKNTYEVFFVIEKAQNGDTAYIVTRYELIHSTQKPSGEIKLKTEKKQFPAQYKDGILERDFSEKFYLEDGKLRANTSKKIFDHISDKSMTFEEMNNGRGYPAPK